MYSAVDVSKYIINRCNSYNKPITNLKLQKMLYFIWIEYYKIKKQFLYENDICAWQFGPVVPDVYYEFCSYAGVPIRQRYDFSLDIDDSSLLDDFIDRYVEIPTSELVGMTHQKNRPWDKIFIDGVGNRETIPFSLIIDTECK